MSKLNDFRLEVYEGEDWILRGYVEDEDGVAITLAGLATTNGDAGMDVSVYDEDSDPSLLVYQETGINLSVASADVTWYPTIIDSSTSGTKTGPSTTGWSKSPPGYNLDFKLTNTELQTGGTTPGVTNLNLPIGGHKYRLEIIVNLLAGIIVLRGYVHVASLSSK